MIRRLFARHRPADRELEAAQWRTAQSTTRARRDLRAAEDRAAADAPLTAELRRHNAANRYDAWLEDQVLRGGR